MTNAYIIWIWAFATWLIVVAILLGIWIRSRQSRIAGKPVLRQAAWISMLPQLFVMGVLVVIFSLFVKPFWLAIYLGVMTYLAASFTLERCIPHHHKKGISLCKRGNYVQAVEEFKKSYHFFSRHLWIDRYRYLTMLSSSKVSYTEMALLNIAFCYAQLHDTELAIEYYQKTLERFPDSEMAQRLLNMISSVENK